MEMKFKEALKHAMQVTGRAKSLRDVAEKAGVSYDILKNINQNKSEKPNAEAAAKIADFFGVSVKDFYAGQVQAVTDEDVAIAEDTAAITAVLRHLGKSSRDQVQAFAQSLARAEEELRHSK